MLQLFPTQDLDAVARPKPVQSAVWSFIVHASVILFLVSLPFLAPEEPLPQRLLATMLVAPAPPAPPPPPAPVGVMKAVKAAVARARVFSPVLEAPKVIPQHVAMVAAADVPILPEVAAGVPGGVPGGILGGSWVEWDKRYRLLRHRLLLPLQ